MAKHKNFYETVKEAEMRLQSTIVLYEGEPYYVLCITDHKADGIFRIYLDKIGFHEKGLAHQRIPGIPWDNYDESPSNSKGHKMDAWLEKNPDSGIVRKFMSSSGFDNYRPFPLGMLNEGGSTFYIERMPQRSTQQGLMQTMIKQKVVDLADNPGQRVARGASFQFFGMGMHQCILGQYPSAKECLKNMLDDKIANTAVGFNRNFALVRGPVDTLFLGYKDDIIGVLPNLDFSRVRLAKSAGHTKEVVDGLKLFDDIRVG